MLSPKGYSAASAAPLVSRDCTRLAPRFAAALLDGLNECWRKGLDPVVYEAVRSEELQAHYYAQGRDRPGSIVTNARSALHSWHGYGLAVDVISASKAWGFSREWIETVAGILKARNLVWGGDWTFVDYPHFQWGAPMRQSPSERARRLLAEGGPAAVWREVRAL